MAGEKIDFVIVLGTGAMLLLAVMVIVFVIFYQRKIFAKQNQINQIKLENQEKLVKAEIDVKEREQKRIAEELHDDIGASLSSMRFIVGKLDDSTETVQDLQNTLTKTIKSVRRISNDLLPHVLSELGIREALSNLVNDLKGLPLTINFTADEYDYRNLDKDEQLALYRIVQELLNNIAKHAEATKVNISLRSAGNEVIIRIVDDGNGIIPEQDTRKHPKTLGLKNIQSRIQYVGGSIKREKNPVKGTTVIITKPLS